MKIRNLYIRIKEGLRTVKGRNALTFFVFLCIATLFWILMALNDVVQHDYNMPLRLVGFPENFTILSGEHPTVNVSVKDKGSALMKYSWGRQPVLTLSYENFSKIGNDRLVMTQAQLNAAVRQVFGSGSQIVSMRPDSLSFIYTTRPGTPVRVHVDADVHTSPQSVAFGRVRVSSDTVMLYSRSGNASKVKELMTAPVVLSGLTDTAEVDAVLQVPAGMRAIPSVVKVTIPVEPLVSKTRRVPIEAINIPDGKHIVTFPSMADVTYLLPKSLYNSDSSPIRVYVDLARMQPGDKKLMLQTAPLPPFCRGVGIVPEMVEYVLESE